jgi:hypothetical protein
VPLFPATSNHFFGNNKADNLTELVENLFLYDEKLSCNVFKDNFFAFSLDFFFSENCGSISDERGELFHRGMSAMGKRYQGKWRSSMLSIYCWTVTRDSSGRVYKRQTKSRRN